MKEVLKKYIRTACCIFSFDMNTNIDSVAIRNKCYSFCLFIYIVPRNCQTMSLTLQDCLKINENWFQNTLGPTGISNQKVYTMEFSKSY